MAGLWGGSRFQRIVKTNFFLNEMPSNTIDWRDTNDLGFKPGLWIQGDWNNVLALLYNTQVILDIVT